MIYVIILFAMMFNGIVAQVIGMYWANKRGYGPSKLELIVSWLPIINIFYLFSPKID